MKGDHGKHELNNPMTFQLNNVNYMNVSI